MKTPDKIKINLLGADKYEYDLLIDFLSEQEPPAVFESVAHNLVIWDFANLGQFLNIALYLEGESWDWIEIYENENV